MMRSHTPLALCIAIVATGLHPVTRAQAPADAAAAVLEEIIVTATKRQTSLMETPLAITAVGADTLQAANISNAKSLDKAVPSLQIRDTGSNGQGSLELSLRGISNANFTEQGDPAVGFHIDGVYTARPQAALQLMYDLERVEVLRGPQGTLFGRNSTVGALNLITAKPTVESLHGHIEISGGDYAQRGVRGMLNIPVSDTLAVRANYYREERDSYYDLRLDQRQASTYTDLGIGGRSPAHEGPGSPGSIDQQAYRISALWSPVAEFSWHLTYEDYQNDAPPAPTTRDCSYAGTTGIAAASQCEDRDHDPYVAYMNIPSFQDLSITNLRSIMAYEFSGFAELKWSYGDSTYEHELLQDLDAGQLPASAGQFELVFWDQPFDNDSYSHELQLTSLHAGRVQWILGYFTFEEETERSLGIDLPAFGGWLDFYQPQRTSESEAVFADLKFALSDQWQLNVGVRYTEDEREDRDGGNYACFGPNCTPFPADSRPNQRIGNRGSDNTASAEFDNTDYKVVLNYTVNEDLFLFGGVSTGYKAGTFQDVNTIVRTGEQLLQVLDPEEVINYEVGVKTTLLEGALNLHIGYYFADYKDKQESAVVSFGDRYCIDPASDPDDPQPLLDPVTGNFATNCEPIGEFHDLEPDSVWPNQSELINTNATDIDIQGIEVEWQWALTDRDYFSGFFTWNKTEINDWETALNCDDVNCGLLFGSADPAIISRNLRGNEYAVAPEFAFTLNYSHRFELGAAGTLTPWISIHWEDDYYLTPFNLGETFTAPVADDPDTPADEGRASFLSVYNDEQDAFATVDFNLRYTSADEKWYAEVWATNITDEEIKTYARGFGGNSYMYAWKAPTLWGMRLGYSF